jgi:hypothetical protein
MTGAETAAALRAVAGLAPWSITVATAREEE